MPRKHVWMGLRISESLYSLWLNPEKPDLPNPVQLVGIVNITGNDAPLRVLARRPDLVRAPIDLATLPETLEADHAADLELARALADGHVTAQEAKVLVPLFRRKAKVLGETLAQLEELARKGRR